LTKLGIDNHPPDPTHRSISFIFCFLFFTHLGRILLTDLDDLYAKTFICGQWYALWGLDDIQIRLEGQAPKISSHLA